MPGSNFDTVSSQGDQSASAASPAIIERLSINNFDVLRLIFASMVMLFHIGVLTQVPSLAWLQTYVSSAFGLQGFFFVSGFLVTLSYDKSSNLASYAWKRARRIGPAYVTVVLLAAFGFVMLSALSWTEYFASHEWRSYVFWNLLLMNFVSPDLPSVFEDHYKQAINGSLWTIKVEVAFYCMMPLMAYLGRHVGKWKAMIGLLFASIIWRVGLDLYGTHTGVDFWSKLAIQAPGQFAFFVAGAIAYERTHLGLPPPQAWMAALAVATYALTSGLFHELVAPFAVGVAVYWAAIGAPFVGRASRYGDFSYGTYLYHWPIIQMLIALGAYTYSPAAAVATTIAATLLMAVCSWYLVERHFLQKSRIQMPLEDNRPSVSAK